MPKKKVNRMGSKGPQVKKKIKTKKVQKMESKIKKKDGVHSKSVVIAAKGSIIKKSIKKGSC